jgi:hypothetical protein
VRWRSESVWYGSTPLQGGRNVLLPLQKCKGDPCIAALPNPWFFNKQWDVLLVVSPRNMSHNTTRHYSVSWERWSTNGYTGQLRLVLNVVKCAVMWRITCKTHQCRQLPWYKAMSVLVQGVTRHCGHPVHLHCDIAYFCTLFAQVCSQEMPLIGLLHRGPANAHIMRCAFCINNARYVVFRPSLCLAIPYLSRRGARFIYSSCFSSRARLVPACHRNWLY